MHFSWYHHLDGKRTVLIMASTVTPIKVRPLRTQSNIFDLDSMSDVIIFKTREFTPVSSAKEANERLGNDASAFLNVLNEGLRAIEQKQLEDDSSIAWSVEDDEGNVSTFSGTPADAKIVNGMVLNLAKGSFGYLAAKDVEGRRAAKQAAFDFIKSQPVLVDGLKAQLQAAKETN